MRGSELLVLRAEELVFPPKRSAGPAQGRLSCGMQLGDPGFVVNDRLPPGSVYGHLVEHLDEIEGGFRLPFR